MCHGRMGVMINSDSIEQGKWHKAHGFAVHCPFISTVYSVLYMW